MSSRRQPSSRYVTPEVNLRKFVERAEGSTAFGAVIFSADIWDIRLGKHHRVTSQHVKDRKLHFTRQGSCNRIGKQQRPFSEPFGSFLKAIARTLEDVKSRHLEEHRNLIAAGRLLYETMELIEFDPTRLTQDNFLEAAKAARALSAWTAYNYGGRLEIIAAFVDKFGLVRVRIDFKNPNKIPDKENGRFGLDAEARTAAKLPGTGVLDAIERISNLVSEDRDVVRMRAVDLLACGGWRINELLTVPADCEVEEQAYKDGEMLLTSDGRPLLRYGIRFHAEKNAPIVPKWIPTVMTDVARRAITDVKRITQPCRELLVWLRSNPGLLPIPKFDSTQNFDDLILMNEIAYWFCGGEENRGGQWCRAQNVPVQKMGKNKVARRKDVINACLAKLPVLPPSSLLKIEEHLFLIPSCLMDSRAAPRFSMPKFLTSSMIHSFLAGGTDCKSAFERFNEYDDQGKPLRMTSHQMRHWLTTLAQRGGMSEMEVARWFGRKDEKSNAFYDHVSGIELAGRVRELIQNGSLKGALAEAFDRLPPRERGDFVDAQVSTAHVTDLGVCIHDWSLTPCMNHFNCAGCSEHLIQKGHAGQRSEAERLLEETNVLLRRAEIESEDQTYGASRWVDAHRRTKQNLEAVLAVHMDESIATGTLVHLPVYQDSRGMI